MKCLLQENFFIDNALEVHEQCSDDIDEITKEMLKIKTPSYSD